MEFFDDEARLLDNAAARREDDTMVLFNPDAMQTVRIPLLEAERPAAEQPTALMPMVVDPLLAPESTNALPHELRPDAISPIATIELAEDRGSVAPDPDPLGSNVGRSALWSALSTLLFKLGNIAIMAVVAREVTQADFGVFAAAITVHTIISSFAELGVASCLMRGDIDVDAVAPTVATISIVSSATLGGAMVVFAGPLASLMNAPSAANPLRVLAIAVLLVGPFAVPAAEMSRNFRQDRQFVASVIGFVPANVLLLVMAHDGAGAMAFAWSRVLGQALTGAAMVVMAEEPFRLGFSRVQSRFLFTFGLPLAGANLLNFVLLNADNALVGRLLGAVELGIYALAFNISSWSTGLLSSMINGVGMAAFSRVREDQERFQRALAKATAAIAFVALPVCGLTLSLAPDLVRTVYGSKWSAAAPVLTILCLYGAISLFCLLLANVLSGMGFTRALFIVQVAWLGSLVPAMAIGVHYGGLVGAAWAHIAIVALVAMPTYLVMLKRSSNARLAPLLPAVAPALIGSAIAALAAWFGTQLVDGPQLRLLVGLFFGGVAYLLIVLPTMMPLMNSVTKLPGAVMRPVERYSSVLNDLKESARPERYRGSGRHRVTS